MTDKLKIAFQMIGGDNWTAGPITLKMLFQSLRATYGDKYGFYILSTKSTSPAEEYANLVGADGVISYNPPSRRSPRRLCNSLIKHFFAYDVPFEQFFKKQNIKAVYGPTLTYNFRKIATLSLVYDFQHVHFPGMFSEIEQQKRTALFMQSAEMSHRLIVWSDEVKKDFESFCPALKHKVRILRLVSCIPQWIYNCDLSSFKRSYNLPEKFIYLPNQLWKHKNHRIAFEAVRKLKQKGVKIMLVCTGNPADSRHPGYFDELWQDVSAWGIRDLILYLGLVPWEDVLLLMRQCVCVLNPSLYEGWGYTVHEADSVGKRVVISDLPVHREQGTASALFFNPQDSSELAEKLERIWNESDGGPDLKLEAEARNQTPQLIREHAGAFISIFEEVLKEIS